MPKKNARNTVTRSHNPGLSCQHTIGQQARVSRSGGFAYEHPYYARRWFYVPPISISPPVFREKTEHPGMALAFSGVLLEGTPGDCQPWQPLGGAWYGPHGLLPVWLTFFWVVFFMPCTPFFSLCMTAICYTVRCSPSKRRAPGPCLTVIRTSTTRSGGASIPGKGVGAHRDPCRPWPPYCQCPSDQTSVDGHGRLDKPLLASDLREHSWGPHFEQGWPPGVSRLKPRPVYSLYAP